MSNDKMRKAFEDVFPTPLGVWWSAEGGKDGGRYMTEFAHVGCVYHQGRWEGFKASRESLVIDIEPDEPEDEGAAYLHKDFVKSRIEAAGLKVTQ